MLLEGYQSMGFMSCCPVLCSFYKDTLAPQLLIFSQKELEEPLGFSRCE